MIPTRFIIVLLVLGTYLTGCASIPPEAPELSAQLGGRISAIESAHRRLLEDYFREKQKRVDEFVQEVWVPVFAQEFFSDGDIAEAWNDVVLSDKDADRLKFILIVAPALQGRINAKRVELMRPLEELESAIASRLTLEYDNMRAINSTLTAFLQSASAVEENRRRYLELVGVTDQKIEGFIDEADKAVAELVKRGGDIEENAAKAERFESKMQEIISRVKG